MEETSGGSESIHEQGEASGGGDDDDVHGQEDEQPSGGGICEFPQEDFDITARKKIGDGGYGEVYLVPHISKQNKNVVLKILRSYTTDSSTSELRAEVEKMRRIRMEYVVEVYGLVVNSDGPVGIIMEHMQLGSVFDVVHKRLKAKLPWALQLRVLKQTAIGMTYLHTNKMLHSDLKTPNLLLNEECRVKLTDFGSSIVRSCTHTRPRSTRGSEEGKAQAGTVAFIAPEVLQDPNTVPSRKQDVYAFGITMWEVQTGKWPYRDQNNDSVIIGWVKDGFRPRVADLPQDSEAEMETFQLMKKCWLADPKERPHFEEIVPMLSRLSDEVAQQAVVDAQTVRNIVLSTQGVVGEDTSMVASGGSFMTSGSTMMASGESTIASNSNTIGPSQEMSMAQVTDGIRSISLHEEVNREAIRSIPDPELVQGIYGRVGKPTATSSNITPAAATAEEETMRHKLELQSDTGSEQHPINLILPGYSAHFKGGGAPSYHHTMSSLPPASGLFVHDEEAVVSDRLLEELAPYIAHRWEDFARHLRLTQSDLAEIASQTLATTDAGPTSHAAAGTPYTQVIVGLQRWRIRFGDGATRKWILAVLVHMGMRNLIYIIERE